MSSFECLLWGEWISGNTFTANMKRSCHKQSTLSFGKRALQRVCWQHSLCWYDLRLFSDILLAQPHTQALVDACLHLYLQCEVVAGTSIYFQLLCSPDLPCYSHASFLYFIFSVIECTRLSTYNLLLHLGTRPHSPCVGCLKLYSRTWGSKVALFQTELDLLLSDWHLFVSCSMLMLPQPTWVMAVGHYSSDWLTWEQVSSLDSSDLVSCLVVRSVEMNRWLIFL